MDYPEGLKKDCPARSGRNQKRRESNRGWTRMDADEEDE
jgi:hypothetical protein